MKNSSLYLMDCYVAGRQYYDVDEVWNELEIRTQLRLERDFQNLYDPNAVAIMYDKKIDDGDGGVFVESFQLGFIPKDHNEFIAKFLEMGWNHLFKCRISKKTPDAHYENQLRITIKIIRNDD